MSNHPGSVAYRFYDWQKGDTGNAQYRVFRYGDSPPGIWLDATGRKWRRTGNAWKPLG